MSLVDELVQGWAEEVAGDHIAPWHIAKALRRRMPGATDDEIRSEALLVARGLLHDPSIEISTFDATDPRYGGPWQGSRDEVVDRLEREWRSLGRDPEPGEIGYIHQSP